MRDISVAHDDPSLLMLDGVSMTTDRFVPRFRSVLFAGVFVCAVVIMACGDSNPIGPSNQPEVANLRDNFQFQASNLQNTTQTLSYGWENTGTAANINVSGQISGGRATMTLRDASGTQIYSANLAATGTFRSSSGTPGDWRIEVRLEDVTGTLNFRIQKP